MRASWIPPASAPGATFYETLGVPSSVFLTAGEARSVYTQTTCRGALVTAFDGLRDGCLAAIAALTGVERGYAFLYWDEIDSVGHSFGPGSAEFATASRAALDAVWEALGAGTDEVTVLITADHGQVDVSPERVDYLDQLWPQLPGMLTYRRPAGSARDVFLHVRDGYEPVVCAGLAERPGERARYVPRASCSA